MLILWGAPRLGIYASDTQPWRNTLRLVSSDALHRRRKKNHNRNTPYPTHTALNVAFWAIMGDSSKEKRWDLSWEIVQRGSGIYHGRARPSSSLRSEIRFQTSLKLPLRVTYPAFWKDGAEMVTHEPWLCKSMLIVLHQRVHRLNLNRR